MRKSKLRQSTELFAMLSSELMERQQIAKSFDTWARLEKKETFRLNDKLWKCWEDLERCLPRIIFLTFYDLWNSPLLDQKTSLVQWMVGKKQAFPNLFNEAWTSVNPSFQPPTAEIWRDADDRYWPNLFMYLDMWRKLTDANLETVEWIVDSGMIKMMMKWKGRLGPIEKLDIRGSDDTFWIIPLQTNSVTCLSDTSTVLLLTTQLSAQQGGNLLSAIEVDNHQLILELNIPRADTQASSLPISLVAERVLEQVVDYILTQISSNYVSASKQVEIALSQEIKRLEFYELKEDEESWFNNLRKILDDLIQMRKSVSI